LLRMWRVARGLDPDSGEPLARHSKGPGRDRPRPKGGRG
jgi:hypothetical protein